MARFCTCFSLFVLPGRILGRRAIGDALALYGDVVVGEVVVGDGGPKGSQPGGQGLIVEVLEKFCDRTLGSVHIRSLRVDSSTDALKGEPVSSGSFKCSVVALTPCAFPPFP